MRTSENRFARGPRLSALEEILHLAVPDFLHIAKIGSHVVEETPFATSLVRAAEQATEEPSFGFRWAWSRQQTNHSGLCLASFLVRLIEAAAKIIHHAITIAELFTQQFNFPMQPHCFHWGFSVSYEGLWTDYFNRFRLLWREYPKEFGCLDQIAIIGLLSIAKAP